MPLQHFHPAPRPSLNLFPRSPVLTSTAFEPVPEEPTTLQPGPISARDTSPKENRAGSSTGNIEDIKPSRNSLSPATGNRATNIYTKATSPLASIFEASARSLETPGSSEDWDATFSTALASQNPRRLREVLARSNPEILLPGTHTSPLSQIVILGLLHRLAMALYKAPPHEKGLFELALQPGKHGSHLFKQTLWWMQRTSAALNSDTTDKDHALFSEVCRIVPDVQRMLTTTKRRCSSLPEGHPASKEADTISQVQAIISRNLGQSDNIPRPSYICINPSSDDLPIVPPSQVEQCSR
ncbi:hypothetical protein FIBSPDRAFT_927841 [Athelia psychrophila]|uniref:Uncharacterized protein n=1 Tax=Athelia psychrophila TaxID=1759441 RepID=A0A166R3H8_9AGAM|nr:hypothetical protein FIBSPDRAFT_927841 [Fibularhizoctonia sp. CBS 109695]